MIILLGFPKSGTTSIHNLLKNNNINSTHWKLDNKYIGNIIKENKYNNKELLNGLKNYECFTQIDVCIDNENEYWPQIIDYKQLYYENQNAYFILNKRNPYELLLSIKN